MYSGRRVNLLILLTMNKGTFKTALSLIVNVVFDEYVYFDFHKSFFICFTKQKAPEIRIF